MSGVAATNNIKNDEKNEISSSDQKNIKKLNNHNNNFLGKAYCFLPLPIISGLPIHVNASFALSSNRFLFIFSFILIIFIKFYKFLLLS